jgi:hypothetical protein
VQNAIFTGLFKRYSDAGVVSRRRCMRSPEFEKRSLETSCQSRFS